MGFLSGKELSKVLKGVLGDKFNSKRIEQAAYELSLGDEVYLTDSETKKPEILNAENKTISINPGQFALLLADEYLIIPTDKLGLISIKASEKLKGLINVSGFHVDPGFKGQLLFSVYNAGPSIITLKKGDPYFLLWFAELKEDLKGKAAYNEDENHHQNQDGIPTKYMDALKNGILASPNALNKQIESNHNELINKLNTSNTNIENNRIKKKDFWVNLRWIAGICIGLLVSLNVAFWINKNVVDNAFKEELRSEQIPEEIDEEISGINFDSIAKSEILKRVNLINLKVKDSTTVE